MKASTRSWSINLALACVAGLAATAASAQYPYRTEYACSGFTVDGRWAVSAGENGYADQCTNVTYQLFVTSTAGIVRWDRSWYRAGEWNTVVLRCQSFMQVFDGFGKDPMAMAIDFAKKEGLSYCLFHAQTYY